jgi:hypothetical protein
LENRSFTYVENAAPTSPVSLTISGNGAISQAQVQLGTGFNANQDRLTILNQSGTSGQISGLNWSYSNGLLTITGNGSAQDYQTALQSVVYQNLSDNPSTDNRTIVYTISGNGFSTQSSQSFSVQSVDDGPVFTVPGNLSVQAGSAGALIAGIDFTDADTPVSNYQLRVVDAQGNVDSRFVIENGQLKLASGQSLSITDSPITLRILADAGAGNIFLSDLLTILISGGGTVQIPGLGTPVTYTEDDGPRSIANLLILEGDAGLVIDQATVRIRDNYSAGQDRLSVDGVTGTSGTTNGLNWTYDAATGTLTFTGNAAPAVYQTALRLVTYSNSSQNPSTAPRSILYTIGGGATPLGTGLATVTVQGVDDLGILTLPQTASIPSGISGAVVGSIAVEDVDTTYTFTVDDDRFEIVNGQLRLKAGQSIAGATSIPLVITATGNAPGVVLTAPLNISVIAGGLAIGGLGAGASYTEDGAPIPLASGLTLAGGAAGTPISGAQVSLTGFVAGQDQLGIAGAPAGVNSGTIAGTGISWTYAPGIGVLNFTGDGSAADYQATLRQVVYSNSSQNPSTAARTAQYTIGSGTGAGVGSLPLTVIAVNDPPTGITLTPAPGPIGVGGTIGTIAVQDPDSTTFTYTFTVNGQPDNRFEIVPGPNGTQVLRLRAGQSLTGPVSLTIGANDGGTPAGTTAQVFQLNPGSTITPIPQSDVIFFDEAGTRKVKVWTVNAANQVVNSANLQNPLTLSDWVLPANWFFLKTGDFDGNGAADILWKDTAGDLQIWYLRPDGTFLGSVPVTLGTTGNRVQIPATTQVVGLANMTADTNLDIVTYDSVTGRSQIWALNGLSNVIGGAPITVSDATGPVSTGPGWEALDLADFDADGDADILFVNRAAGTISVWRLNGTQFVGATGLGTPTATGFPALPASYQFGTTGDFTGDGRTDIIWRVNGGDPVLWQVTDNGTAFSAVQTTLPNVDPGWQLGGAGRFNADTTADVVWRNVNPNIGQVLWTFNNGVPTPSVFTYNGVPGTTPGATALLTDSPTWKIFGLGDYAAVSAAPVTPPTPITP